MKKTVMNNVLKVLFAVSGILNIILGARTKNISQIFLGFFFISYILDINLKERQNELFELQDDIIEDQKKVIETIGEMLKNDEKIIEELEKQLKNENSKNE